MGGPHPPLSQIPLPAPGSSSQDKHKPTLPPLGVPPPSGDPSALTGFGDPMLQLPFTLPPQLQLQGNAILSDNNYVPDFDRSEFVIGSVSIYTKVHASLSVSFSATIFTLATKRIYYFESIVALHW